MKIVFVISLLIFGNVASQGQFANKIQRMNPKVVTTVKLTNNSDTPVSKMVVEKRFVFTGRAFDEIPVKMASELAAGATTTVTLRLDRPDDGTFYALVWYWAPKCYAVGRVPAGGGSFTSNTGKACSPINSRDPVPTPRQARIDDAINTRLSAASEQIKKKNYSTALTFLNEALTIAPQNEAVLHRRGHVHHDMGNYDQAVRDFVAAIRISKDREHLYIDSAKAFLAQKNYGAAINQYSLAIAIVPSAANYRARGKAYFEHEKFEKAIADFTEVLQRYETDAEAHGYRGLAYKAISRKDLAAADFRKFMELSPDRFFGYLELGKLSEASKAEPLFTKAIEFTAQAPKYRAQAYLYRGVSRFLLSKFAEAAVDLDEAIKLEPNDTNAQLFRGKVYVAQGDNSTAIKFLTKAHTLEPNALQPLEERGLAYCRLGRKAEATADFTKSAARGGMKLTCDK